MTKLPLIRDKHDVKNAERLVELGYPAVAEALPDLLEWIQDMNWPVAGIVGPFLATIGRPLTPQLQRVMQSDDLIWKYWCIQTVIAEMPLDATEEFEPELRRLARDPTPRERHHELHEVAEAAVIRLAQRRAES